MIRLNTFLKLNQNLKFTILLIFLISFSSCEKEEDNYQQTNSENGRFHIETLVNNEFQTNNKVVHKLNSLTKQDNSSHNNFSGKVYYDEYNFTIHTDLVKYVEDEASGIHSYNFVISRENSTDDYVENLFLSLNENGEYDAYIIKYGFTNEEFYQLDENTIQEFTSLITPIDIDMSILNNNGQLRTEQMVCIEIWDWVPCDEGELTGCYGEEFVLISLQCLGGGGTGGNNTGDGENNTGDGSNNTGEGEENNSENGPSGTGTGNGTSGTTIPTHPYITTPVPLTLKQKLEGMFELSTPAHLLWAGKDNNMEDADKLLSFVLNICSEDSTPETCQQGKDIGQAVLDILVADNTLNFEDAFEQFFIENPDVLVVEGPDIAIDDMEEYLDCFDTTLLAPNAKITIYVDEPVENSTSVFSLNDGVGHTFITIEQGGNVASFGFYPLYSLPSLFTPVTGVMGNNSNTVYDVSLSIDNISPSDLQLIINHAVNYANLNYDLHWNNCTDMGISVANLVGLPISDCNADPLVFFGSTPGRLGQYIRNLTSLPNGVTKNDEGGVSPNNNCD